MASGLDVLLGGGAGGGSGLDVLMGGIVPPMQTNPADVGSTLRPFGIDTGIQMSPNWSNTLAGVGKGMTDLAQGAGQMIGVTDRQDVQDKRSLDKALMETRAGRWGAFGGNVATALPTAFVPGVNTMGGAALVNGVLGLMQPSTSTGETALNTGLGAATGPLALAGGRLVAAGYQGAKALLSPFFQSGQEAIAANALQRSATDPARAAANLSNAGELVPGSRPTTAQVAQDPGLAQLERTLRGMPETAPGFNTNDAAQRLARMDAVENIAGRGDHYDAITQGRGTFANEDYAAAIKQGIDPQMAKAMAPQIQSLMERPSIQAAQRDAVRLAKENGITLADSPSGSLQGLDWIKKALDNKISIASNPGSSIGKEDLRALMQTKNDLMSLMEQLSPAYKAANDNYAAMSRQVNSMDVARDLLGRLRQPGSEYAPGGGKEMANSFMRSLSQSKDSVKKATGMNQGIADAMAPGDVATLENIARDLGRKGFVQDAGRAYGSNTAQNLASQNLLRSILGPTGMPQSWAEQTLLQTALRPYQWAVNAGEPKIQGLLARAMLDPKLASALLTRSQGAQPMAQMGLLMQPYLPSAGAVGAGLLSNALTDR